MNAAAVLLIALSSDGYWFAGHTATVRLEWLAPQAAPKAVVHWRLDCGSAPVASGQAAIDARTPTVTVSLRLPEVRVASDMRIRFRLTAGDPPKILADETRPVQVFPPQLLSDLGKRMQGKNVLVWDQPERLPDFLKQLSVPCTIIQKANQLQFVRPDVVIVGEGRLPQDGDAQARLLNLAGAGSGVLILRQTALTTLAGYRVSQRPLPAKLEWQPAHPLSEHLRWFERPRPAHGAEPPARAFAVRLPADEPALEIAWWPAEIAQAGPAPIDALAVAKTLGKGRIVLCQMPLGPWADDPRSQLFLGDALDYLLSPVAPTLPVSKRQRVQPVVPPQVPTITIP